MQRIDQYILIHTHPTNSSFSKDDIRKFVSETEIHTILAVGFDETVYIMARKGSIIIPGFLLTEYDREESRLIREYFSHYIEEYINDKSIVKKYETELNELLCKSTHEICEKIFPRFGPILALRKI